jgi:copper chaperone CopZ
VSVAPPRTEVFPVSGMHCGGCERTVTRALLAVPGVRDATADFVAEEVEVTFDPARVEPEAIRSAVLAAGFLSP